MLNRSYAGIQTDHHSTFAKSTVNTIESKIITSHVNQSTFEGQPEAKQVWIDKALPSRCAMVAWHANWQVPNHGKHGMDGELVKASGTVEITHLQV